VVTSATLRAYRALVNICTESALDTTRVTHDYQDMPPTVVLLTSSQAAAQLGVHPATLRRWADAGRVRHVKFPNGRLRFDPADLDAWLTAIEPVQAAS